MRGKLYPSLQGHRRGCRHRIEMKKHHNTALRLRNSIIGTFFVQFRFFKTHQKWVPYRTLSQLGRLMPNCIFQHADDKFFTLSTLCRFSKNEKHHTKCLLIPLSSQLSRRSPAPSPVSTIEEMEEGKNWIDCARKSPPWPDRPTTWTVWCPLQKQCDGHDMIRVVTT